MLQRAASNAYSWWWASHIRTKQSKWMEQNLLDMEEKVQNVLKLIEEDGDSFARRAEMYYKKRPELINFVEETYRAYRALAERYDHISTELQNANNTIASVFPEQVQFSMDEEDEEAMPKFTRKLPEMNKANIPKVPKAPIDLKTVITTATKKLKSKKNMKLAAAVSAVVKSGLNKQEALSEIDKLQKQILSLQTEKEFLKSSYESQLERYWEIENQIKEMQDRVFNLQDEYGEGMVIEDDEARNLMAKAALKSCQESLAQLQEKQERSAEEARIESTRIREVRERLDSLKGELHGDGSIAKSEPVRHKPVPDQLNHSPVEEKQRAEELRQKIKDQLEASTCLTMTEMAEKIDELVNKVISLETALSSQTALVNQLRSETDELQTQIWTLEDDKASIIDGKNNLQQKLKDMEKKLGGIQNLNQKVENEKSNFQSQIIEVHCNLDHLSDKLPSVQQDEEPEPEPKSSISSEQPKQPEKLPGVKLGASGAHTELKQPDKKLKAHEEPKPTPSISTVQLEQLEKLSGVMLGASGAHTELKQTNEKLKAHEESKPKSSTSTVQLEQPEKLSGVMLGASGAHTELKQPDDKLNAHEEPKPNSSTSTVQLEQPEKLSSVRLGASGAHTELKQPDEKLKAHEEPKPKSSTSTVQLEQPEKLSGIMLGAGGAHTELKQPDEKLKAHEESKPKSSIIENLPSLMLGASGAHTDLKQPNEKLKAHEGPDDPKQKRADEACQATDSRRNEESAIELQSSKEGESQNFKGKSEKVDASGINRNQENTGPTQVDPPNLGSNSKKLEVNATSRSLVEVVDTRGNSQSSKSNADVAAKSEEVIAQTLSVNTNDANGSSKNPVEVVQTKANSRHSEGDRAEAGANAPSRSQVEVKIQDKSQSSKDSSYEKSDAGNTAISREGNPKKNGDNGSAGNPREGVQTKANSQYSEDGVNGTLTSQVEEIHKQANLRQQNKEENKACLEAVGADQEQEVANKVDEPNWQQLFLSGIEDREKVLLTEYTTTLRNFKDAKKKLSEMDEKNRDHHLQTAKQLNELKTANALKDQEIRSLHHKLNLMQKCFYESRESVDLSAQSIDFSADDPDQKKTSSTSQDQNVEHKIARPKKLTRQISDESGFDISKLLAQVQQPATTSEIEERLRIKIDELLEENLDFWLQFSTSFHQIQKFETGIQDLKSEVTKLQEKGKKMDDNGSGKYSLKSEARPLYKHLREIQTELNVWSDKSAALNEELENRFSSLCNIQEEITAGLKASAEDDDFSFTSYQAAKFQGEVLNMKQENNKVAHELQAALDHIASLQLEVETNLTKLNEEFRLSGSNKQEITPQLRHSESRNRVPLRSFIFGVKPKKQKQSIFSGMAPVMQKKYYALRTGTPL